MLLAILCVQARRRGIAELRGWVLPDNHRVIGWFSRLGARIDRGQHEWQVRFAVPSLDGQQLDVLSSIAHLQRLMRQVDEVLRQKT